MSKGMLKVALICAVVVWASNNFAPVRNVIGPK
jgi:hypothetical protein